MSISDKQLEELRSLYSKNCGVDISIEDAKRLGEKLISLLKIVCLSSDE